MGNREMIDFRSACASDLEAIVRIHCQAFATFFLTRLGPRFLMKYYRLVMEHPSGILIIAANKDDVVGFVAGFASPAKFYVEMKKRKISFALASMPSLLRSPGIIRRLWIDFREVRTQARPAAPHETGVGGSSIGVDPAWSGRGIGQGLLEAYVAEARKHGLKAFTLTTDADDNDAVNQFYRKVGFYLSRTFTQRDQRRMNEYRMNIL